MKARILLTLALSAMLAAPAMADPPSHAPAHGYRDKGKSRGNKHRGYTGAEWERDYGVSSGRCDTDTVLAVLGAAGGAMIGNRTASPENRTIATIAGAIIGGVIGNEIGEAIDDADRGCVGHSLEVGRIGQAVTWRNPRTRVAHTLTPTRDLKDGCRMFTYRAGERGKLLTLRGCRGADAAWVIRRN